MTAREAAPARLSPGTRTPRAPLVAFSVSVGRFLRRSCVALGAPTSAERANVRLQRDESVAEEAILLDLDLLVQIADRVRRRASRGSA